MHDDWGATELTDALGIGAERLRVALGRLFALALVRDSADGPGRIHAVDPEVGLHQALARQQADLARRQHQVAESQAGIAQLIDDVARRRGTAPAAAELLGPDAVQDRLARLTRASRSEMLTFISDGPVSASELERARISDEQLLRRRVRIRTVGLNGIRTDQPAVAAYGRFLVGAGAEFRTAAVLPPSMVIVDRRAAVLSLDPADPCRGALCLTGPGVTASMVALFHQVWDLATPLDAMPGTGPDDLTDRDRALLKLLADGLTDDAAALRLGISTRTARRIMAELMERLNTRSRFEAGVRAAQRGWI